MQYFADAELSFGCCCLEATTGPKADAGEDKNISAPLDTVTLDGSKSEGAVTFLWTQFRYTAIQLSFQLLLFDLKKNSILSHTEFGVSLNVYKS